MPVQRGSGPRASRRRSGSGGPFPAGAERRWVPVVSLPPLARALLSEDLGGREEVPRHVAQRVTAEADRWSEQGFFSAEEVRAWADLPPAAAAYLAQRGVSPRVLDLPTRVARAAVPLKLAIATGVMPVERAYELLVATGEHQPPDPAPGPAAPAPVDVPAADGAPAAARMAVEAPAPAWSGPREEQPARQPVAGRPVAPVVFSHAVGWRPQPVDG